MWSFPMLFGVFLQVACSYGYDNYFMRIEAQLIRLENPSGITASGRPCSGTPFIARQCNTIVKAYIDTEGSNRVGHVGGRYGHMNDREFEIISTHLDDNDPHIGQSLSKDICGKSMEKAVVRVRVAEQGLSGEQRINDFICESALHTHHAHSLWSPVQLCRAEFQKNKMRLYFRYRVTRLEQNQCQDLTFKPSHYP